MRIYLAGPMTGIENHNFPAFDAARDWLRNTLKWVVISPADMSREFGIDGSREVTPEEWRECMKDDIGAILRSHALVVLPGWQGSRGARREILIAQTIGIPIYQYDLLRRGVILPLDEAEITEKVGTCIESH